MTLNHVCEILSENLAVNSYGKFRVIRLWALVFAEDWACEIELYQTGVICFPWRQRSWPCGVFKSSISDTHCPFRWKWQALHNYDISVLQQVGMFFDGITCLMKVGPLFKREFPRVPMTWRSARARIFIAILAVNILYSGYVQQQEFPGEDFCRCREIFVEAGSFDKYKALTIML